MLERLKSFRKALLEDCRKAEAIDRVTLYIVHNRTVLYIFDRVTLHVNTTKLHLLTGSPCQ